MTKQKTQQYEATIGLEIHAELKTQTKMFCGCDNLAKIEPKNVQELEPNINICPVCMAMPGVLPVLNKQAIYWTILTGLALNCKVNKFTKWDRKNYFYPDIPKGYQISQYDLPLVYDGYLEINPKSEIRNPKQIKISNNQDLQQNTKKIRITRIHLEEDTATSKHPEGRADIDYSLVDFNRAGVPLMELVTEPDIKSAEEAKIFCQNYQQVLRDLKIADADMEKGQMRCEANVSVRKIQNKSELQKLGTKVEIKNLNSFKSVEKAIEYEIRRQIELVEEGEKIIQETRGWDEKNQRTYLMRKKETSADYRYFPEPDLPPVAISDKEIEEIKKQIPKLSKEIIQDYQKRFEISWQDAQLIATDINKKDFFEKTIDLINFKKDKCIKKIKNIVNYIINEIPNLDIKPKYLVELINLIDGGKISNKIAKDILPEIKKGQSPKEIIKNKGLEQVSDSSSIEPIIDDVINKNPDAVAKIKSGQVGVIGFLVGQVMAVTQGKANPKIVNEILEKKLK